MDALEENMLRCGDGTCVHSGMSERHPPERPG